MHRLMKYGGAERVEAELTAESAMGVQKAEHGHNARDWDNADDAADEEMTYWDDYDNDRAPE